jgi:hypothetical protein
MRAIPILAAASLWTLGCATTSDPQTFDTSTADAADTLNDLADAPPDAAPDAAPDAIPDGAVDTLIDPSPDATDTVPPDTDAEAAPGGVVGDPCFNSTQCMGVPGAGRACLTSLMGYVSFPGGYCSATCTSAADCGTGAQCVNLMDVGEYCLKQCASNADCRTADTYTCDAVPGATGTFCIPPISTTDS